MKPCKCGKWIAGGRRACAEFNYCPPAWGRWCDNCGHLRQCHTVKACKREAPDWFPLSPRSAGKREAKRAKGKK